MTMTLDMAFPAVDPGIEPLGNLVLVQLRNPRLQTKGGILLSDESRDIELWNCQIAKVLKIGPLAYKDLKTLEPWPEGAWVAEGEYVRVPKYGGDKWHKGALGKEGFALFAVFKDREMLGKITESPLEAEIRI